ncbi:arabinose transporter [Mesorhizobium sp. 128a]
MTMRQRSVTSTSSSLFPLTAAVLVVFLVTGAALPTLPLHIHDRLGYGPFAIGLVSGAQFVAALVSRLWSGSFSDRRGPKQAVVAGLVMGAASGLLYLLSLLVIGNPLWSAMVLLVGRALLGGAESFVITGAQAWGLALANPGGTGKVIGWMGTAMYVGLAAGAPVGSLLFNCFGFAAIGVATLLVPLATMLIVAPMRAVHPHPQAKRAFASVAKAVWLPGIGMSCASLGYGAMTAFSVLYFAQQGWQPAWLSFTAFALALILARLAFGGLPDRMGGARAAMIFVVLQALGMGLMGLSPSALPGFVGAALTGFGYAFVYPGLGIEAVRRAPVESRGLAMGIYTAFLDLALGILAPLLGLVANLYGLGSVFIIGALLALCTVPIAARLRFSAPQTSLHLKTSANQGDIQC